MSNIIPKLRDVPTHDSNGRKYTEEEIQDMEAEMEFQIEEARMEAAMEADGENYIREMRGETDWMED